MDSPSVDLRIGDDDGRAVGVVRLYDMFLVQPLILLHGIDPENPSQQNQGQDESYDAEGICHGVAECDGRLIAPHGIEIGLLGGTEGGGVGHGARHDTCHGDQAGAAQGGDKAGDKDAGKYDAQGEHIEFQSVLLERREKTGAYLHTHGIYEEDQAELLDETQDLRIDAHLEMAEGDSHEEYPCDSERNASDFHLAEQSAESNRNRKYEYDVGSTAAEKQFCKHTGKYSDFSAKVVFLCPTGESFFYLYNRKGEPFMKRMNNNWWWLLQLS